MNTPALAPLGTGPVATVYAGVTETGEAAAVKVYPAPLDRDTRAALDRELAALEALRPVAAVLSADELELLPDGRPALWMPRAAQSLADLTAGGQGLPVLDALVIAEAVALALAAAHQAGQVHGGVTPGNVLLLPSGEPVLADFGVVLRQRFTPGESRRAVDFAAPEAVRAGTLDERGDVYGLGAILHLALTGRSPHPPRVGEQPGQHILRVLNEPVAPVTRADVPQAATGLLAVLLAKDPAHRPDAATAARRLSELVNGSAESTVDTAGPAAARPPVTAPVLPEPIAVVEPRGQRRPALSRHRTAILAAGGLVLAAALAAVFLLGGQEQPPPPAEPPVGAPVPAPAPQPGTGRVDLDPPADHGTEAELRWRGPDNLFYVVIVTEQGLPEPRPPILVQRKTSARVPVEPGKQYCFLVQGTDARGVYNSQYQPFRGATCRR
ncbi:serine/threonine protein kinase [Amycolatopsis suaedae]|nr:protein kinase [Amycolatopsis suaedae]